jgi:lipid II:glycine glycyltransferase (peptidoglycan interpeptide bridge formation enzyme)
MDTEAYRKSPNSISLLRSHDELPEKEYFLKIGYKTFLIDLSKTKEAIYSAFDYTGARYKINKAQKKGVIVKKAETAAEKQKFYDFYQAFAGDPKRKNKILVLQEEELNRLDVFCAVSAEGEYLGGTGLLPSPDRRYLLYKYSATLHRSCENELLLWHAIQYAKDAQYAYFDMSWMWPAEDEQSDQYRLYQFKKKFGGDLVDFYTYVKLKGLFKVPGALFKLILKYFFKGDIINFTLRLKKLKGFK